MITYNYILMQKDDVQRQVDAAAKAGIGLIAIKSQGKTPDAQESPRAFRAALADMTLLHISIFFR